MADSTATAMLEAIDETQREINKIAMESDSDDSDTKITKEW